MDHKNASSDSISKKLTSTDLTPVSNMEELDKDNEFVGSIVDDIFESIEKEATNDSKPEIAIQHQRKTVSVDLTKSDAKRSKGIFYFNKLFLNVVKILVFVISERKSNDMPSSKSSSLIQTRSRPMSFTIVQEQSVIDSSSDRDDSLDSFDLSDYANSDLTDTELMDTDDCSNVNLLRNTIAFWLIGLCHQMTYHLALAATRDVLHLYVRDFNYF